MRRLFSIKVSENALAFALLILRLGLGTVMMVAHGFDKLQHFSLYRQKFGDPIGLGPTTSLALTVFAEFFCAAFIVLGLFTRLAAIPLIIAMSVALFIAHKGDFFYTGELAGLYLTGFLTILFAGPGKISLDRFISK